MLLAICLCVVGLNLLTYLIPHVIVSLFGKPRNLKKVYKAEWGLVTGSSSGIGLSIAKKLASQGLNVVLVALEDSTFDAAVQDLKVKYPDVQFRQVGVDLSRPGYLAKVQDATADIDVQIIFCNAGYIVTGFFEDRSLDQHIANMEVNAGSAVQITHHFVQKLLAKKLPGCFVYTSSAAAVLPSPFSVMYAATKSFISAFGASLAAELKPFGIDVLVVHPSPVKSRFYDKTHKLDALEFFKQFAVEADELPDVVFGSIGRCVWRDIGGTAIGFRMLMKFLDYNFLAMLTSRLCHTMSDFKRYAKQKAQ